MDPGETGRSPRVARSPARRGRVVRGNVTPSRASRFFLPRRAAPPSTPVQLTPPLSISHSTPYLSTPSDAGDAAASSPCPHTPMRLYPDDASSDDECPPSPTLGRRTLPGAVRKRKAHAVDDGPASSPSHARVPQVLRSMHTLRAPAHALWALRTQTTRSGFGAALTVSTSQAAATGTFIPRMTVLTRAVDATAYLRKFTTDPDAYYMIESGCIEHAAASPLSAAYMHASRQGDRAAQCLAVGDDEGRVHLLDTLVPPGSLGEEACKWTTRPLLNGSVFEMQWRYDDQVLGIGGSDYSVSAYDVQHEMHVAEYHAHEGSPRTLAWDPNGWGRILASGARDDSIYVWDLRMQDAVQHIPRAHGTRRTRQRRASAGVTSITYTGSLLASAGSENGVVKLWDLRMAGAARPARSRANGTSLEAASSADLSLRDRALNTRPHGISSLVVAPTRHRLYAACTDGCIYTLSSGADEPLAPTAEALYHPVQRQNTLYARLALHQERFLALGCNSGDIVLWDVAGAAAGTTAPAAASGPQPGAGCAVLRDAHERNAEVNAVAWTTAPSGPILASASDDQTVRLWASGAASGTA